MRINKEDKNMKYNDELMLSESLSKTVFDSTKPLVNDIGEATLDLFLNDGFAKDLPLINVACSLYNIGKTIQDANHRRNIVLFLESLRRGTITDEQKEKRRKYFKKNSKNASKEIEQILLILYQLTEKENAVYIGNFYLALIDEEITFDEFRTYVSTLQKLCPGDIVFLPHIIMLQLFLP